MWLFSSQKQRINLLSCSSSWFLWPYRLAWWGGGILHCILPGSDRHLCLLGPVGFSWRTCPLLQMPDAPALASTQKIISLQQSSRMWSRKVHLKQDFTLAFFFMCLSSGWTACGPGWANAPNEYFFKVTRWNCRNFIGPMWVGKKGCLSSSAGMECWLKKKKKKELDRETLTVLHFHPKAYGPINLLDFILSKWLSDLLL